MLEVYKFIGADPSFSGFGFSQINLDNKTVWFREFSVDVKHGAFAEIAEASVAMVDILEKEIDAMSAWVGMEIPPVSGMYAVKLWALDSRVYWHLRGETENIWLFNVPYLKFINSKYGKNYSKKDTMKMIEDILEIFKEYKFEIIQDLKDKRGKPRKLTSNECDSFLYCIRIFVKYSLEYGKNADLVSEILNINEKFTEEKETKIGKKVEKND